jgi:AraC family L-rhamnose operon transcriptional activator RhaR
MIVRVREESLACCLEHWEALRLVQGSLHRAEVLGRLLILMDCLVQAVEEVDILRLQPRPLHSAVLQSLHLLESQTEREWSLRELAELVHMNPSYLVRLFKTDIGLSPIAYLNHCRLERATGLLLHTGLSISEVAAQVGWYDPNLFARRFRLAHGISPSEYRKQFG